jgi:hypothetical protein
MGLVGILERPGYHIDSPRTELSRSLASDSVPCSGNLESLFAAKISLFLVLGNSLKIPKDPLVICSAGSRAD